MLVIISLNLYKIMTDKELDDEYKNSKNSYEVFYDHDDETKVTQYRFFFRG